MTRVDAAAGRDDISGRSRTARDRLTDGIGPAGAFVVLLGGGVLLLFLAMLPLGAAAGSLEQPLDRPFYLWVAEHRSPGWSDALRLAGTIGDQYQSWAIGMAGGLLLVLLAPPGRRWVPPVLLITTIVVENYHQMALGKVVDRGHPPGELGTFPSGGCARVLAIYGMLIFLVLAYTGATAPVRRIGWTVLGALALLEAFARVYVGKHWFTDVPAGLVYGVLLLCVLIFAARPLVAGRREV